MFGFWTKWHAIIEVLKLFAQSALTISLTCTVSTWLCVHLRKEYSWEKPHNFFFRQIFISLKTVSKIVWSTQAKLKDFLVQFFQRILIRLLSFTEPVWIMDSGNVWPWRLEFYKRLKCWIKWQSMTTIKCWIKWQVFFSTIPL